MGLEDHDGDMDFKVAGTKWNYKTLQMDIKLGGDWIKCFKEAFAKQKKEEFTF